MGVKGVGIKGAQAYEHRLGEINQTFTETRRYNPWP